MNHNPRIGRLRREHIQKKTNGWIQRQTDGNWYYLRNGISEAEVFKVCPSDTFQVRWAGKIYRGEHKVGQTFEDDYTARSVVEVMVNLLVPPP